MSSRTREDGDPRLQVLVLLVLLVQKNTDAERVTGTKVRILTLSGVDAFWRGGKCWRAQDSGTLEREDDVLVQYIISLSSQELNKVVSPVVR